MDFSLAAREAADFNAETQMLAADTFEEYCKGATQEAAAEQACEDLTDPFEDTCPFGECPFAPEDRDCKTCQDFADEMEAEDSEGEYDPGEYVEWQDLFEGDEDPPNYIDEDPYF